MKERSVRLVFWFEVALCIVCAILCTVGLLLPRQPIFVWLPAVLLLTAVLATLALLLSLDRGLQFRSRTPVVIYAVGRLLVTLLVVLVAVLLTSGLVAGARRHSFLPVAVPLLVLAVVVAMFGCYAALVAFRFSRQMPEGGFDAATLTQRTNGHAAKTNGLASQNGRTGNGNTVNNMPMTDYPVSTLPATTTDSSQLKGSQHTVFTMASDV